MIEHLVFFNYDDTHDHDTMIQIINAFYDLLGVIPGLIEISMGENITEETNYSHGVNLGLRMLFHTHAELKSYLVHPTHVQLSELVKKSVNKITVCDFYVKS